MTSRLPRSPPLLGSGGYVDTGTRYPVATRLSDVRPAKVMPDGKSESAQFDFHGQIKSLQDLRILKSLRILKQNAQILSAHFEAYEGVRLTWITCYNPSAHFIYAFLAGTL